MNIQEIALTFESLPTEELDDYLTTEELQTLHSIKLHLDDIYYNTGESTVSDYRYDKLKEALLERDPTYVPPVGVRIREHENRVRLPYWLGSMDKIKPENGDTLVRWLDNNPAPEYLVTEKLDGVSCLFVSEGNRTKLYTRGDGVIGADISYIAQYLSLPSNLEDIAIRGELIMTKETFERKYADKYKNPRNLVSGILGSKTIKSGIRDITFVTYEIIGSGEMPPPSQQLELLSELGFTTALSEIVKEITMNRLGELLVSFKTQTPYEIDGIIVQSDISYYRNTSGNPSYSIAFKMMTGENVIDTEVREVDWNISKWGQLKPRILINPVELNGVTVSKATAFNAKFVRDNSIGPGAIVRITRSGDVIPYIIEVIQRASEPQMPEIPYTWGETEVDIYTNTKGSEMCIKLISNIFSSLKIKHVSEATVRKLYDHGFNSFFKIIAISKEELEMIEGIQKKSAKRIHDNIRNGLQNVSLPVILGSSGVLGYGIGSKKIEELLRNIPDLFKVYKTMSKESLVIMIITVEGFSEKTATKIVNNIGWADKFIQKFGKYATYKIEEVVSDVLKGKIIVLSGFRGLEDDIKLRGGKVTNTISKNTFALVVINKEDINTRKVEKARSLGIPIYTREEFVEQFLR